MKSKVSFKIIFILSVIFISLITLSYFLIFNNGKNNNILQAVDQIQDSREWVDIILDTVYFREYNAPIIYAPFKAKIDRWENLYVLDMQLNSVLKFSPTGKFIRKFGYGKGAGPGEFLNPRDFYVDFDGKVYIDDADRMIITVFDSTSKLEKTIRPKNSGNLDKFTVFRNQKFFLKTLSVGSFFKIYSNKGNLIKTFGDKFLPAQNSISLPVDVFLCGSGNKVYGTFIMAGYIFSYDTTGSLLFYRNTIDKINFPRFFYKKNGESSTTYYDRNAKIVNWDISFSSYGNEGIIYVHPYYASKKLHALVLDAYEAKKGKYMYSFKIKRPSRKHGITSCIIHDKYLYLVGEGATTILIKYKIRLTKNSVNAIKNKPL